MVHPKILIIGAGASGIAAASRLLQNSITNITILEAENRIGGRINSVDFGGSVVDLGGQWCHGENGNIVYQLVKNLNLLGPSHNNYQDNTYYLSNGKVLDKHITDRIYKIFESIFGNTEASIIYSGSYGNYFIQQYNEIISKEFSNNKEALDVAKVLLDWFHKFFNCLNSTKTWNDISVKGGYQFKKCEGDQQLNWGDKGYKTILHVLMKKIPDSTKQLPIEDKIFLNKEVNKIVWDFNNVNNDGVTVNCADGSCYNADHVIITVSLGVLKNLYKTSFMPELPSFKQNAIEGMTIGTVNKVLLKFPFKWWPNDFKGFSLVWNENDSKKLKEEFPHGPISDGKSWLEDIFGFYVIDSHPRTLLGWIVGKMADKVELLSDEIVRDGCMFLLKKFVGNKFAIPTPDDILRSKWKTNPHFCGSYVHYGLEAEIKKTSADELAQPVLSSNNKQVLLFAGEGTHTTYFSTVHGAIETGYREADRIINIYK